MARMPGQPRGLSLLQLAKVILACAVASACITPTFRLFQYGLANLSSVLIVDAIAVPLVWALLGYVLVRRGPRRALMIVALLLCSVMVALGSLIWASHPLLAGIARH